jgi:predicted metal-dependent RNase
LIQLRKQSAKIKNNREGCKGIIQRWQWSWRLVHQKMLNCDCFKSVRIILTGNCFKKWERLKI